MSVIEHRPDHVTVPVCQRKGCPLYGMGAAATCDPDHVALVAYVPADQLTGAVSLTDEQWNRVLGWLHMPVPPGPAKALDESIIRAINAQRGQ